MAHPGAGTRARAVQKGATPGRAVLHRVSTPVRGHLDRPRPSPELETVLSGEGIGAARSDAALDGDPAALVARTWELDGIGAAYREWPAQAMDLIGRLPDDAGDARVFAARSRLLHGWRNFLFRDPGLPTELLPRGWPGEQARIYFEHEAGRLLPAAAAFVDRHLGQP